MTTPDYVHHYANERRASDGNQENYVLTFLAHLFTHKTVPKISDSEPEGRKKSS